MKTALAKAILDDDVTRLAVAVGATEAAAFRYVRTPDNQRDLELLHHIRPGSASAEQRADAVRALRDMAMCVTVMKDGLFVLDGGSRRSYCLVLAVMSGWAVSGALTFVTPCGDDAEARTKLRRLQQLRRREETP
jgi:hypothetical protein